MENKCPGCANVITRRVEGNCPKCTIPLLRYSGVWIDNRKDSPPKQLLRIFENLISDKLSLVAGITVVHRTPKPHKNEELGVAKRIWEDNSYDLEVCTYALELLFQHKQFSFKTYTALKYTQRDFPIAVSMARPLVAKRRAEEQLMNINLERLAEKEDIFN